MVNLTVYRGGRVVQELDLEGEEISIGRNPGNQVVLPDDGQGVSRVHARLRVEGGSLVLYDNNSRNGTLVDGKKIQREVLQPGREFVIGPFRLVINSPAAVADAEGDDEMGEGETMEGPRPSSSSSGTAIGREGTARPAAGQTHSKRPVSSQTASGRTAGGGSTLSVARQPRLLFYAGVGVLLVALGGLLIWQLWPDSETREIAQVSTTTTVESTTTTSIPETTVDPHAERLASARTEIEAAEQLAGTGQHAAAARAFNRAVREHLTPILAEDPSHVDAGALQKRAQAGADEARKQLALLTPAVTAKDYGPTAVRRRENESEADYERRNREAHQDYDLAKRYYDEGNFRGALKVFRGLMVMQNDWRDVSTYVRNSQEALDGSQQRALAEAVKLETAGYEAQNARRFLEAKDAYLGARRGFENAGGQDNPTAQKRLEDLQGRMRALSKACLDSARTHANNGRRGQAIPLLRAVLEMLPENDPIRIDAAADLKQLDPGIDDAVAAAADSRPNRFSLRSLECAV